MAKKASVNEIWNALKEDEATRSTRRTAARTTVDWNSYHIRDAIKPKKKSFPAYDSHLADYSLMEAAHLFRNSNGTLEVGCPYDCREKCRSFNKPERESNNEEKKNAEPDLVLSQYAKLKAAYQEKLKKEKLAALANCVEQMKDDIVAAEEQEAKDIVQKATEADDAVLKIENADSSELQQDRADVAEPRSVRFALPDEESQVTTGQHQDMANALNRDLNALTDAVGGVRLAALQRLQSTLFESKSETLGSCHVTFQFLMISAIKC